MGRRRDDVEWAFANKTLAQTWAAVLGTRVRLTRLWPVLFSRLATDAGLPVPKLSGGIACYEGAGHADALAAHAEAVLVARARDVMTVGILRFELEDKEIADRHCVLVQLG